MRVYPLPATIFFDGSISRDVVFPKSRSYLTSEKWYAMQALPVYKVRGHEHTYKSWHLELQKFFAFWESDHESEESSDAPESIYE